MGSCPFMSNLIATATDETWSYEQLMLNTICHFCNKMHFNNWFSCNRRASMINLHPGLLSFNRHHFFLVKIIAKFAISPSGYPKIVFSGHPGAKTMKHSYKIPHVSLPKPLQIKQYITHGK